MRLSKKFLLTMGLSLFLTACAGSVENGSGDTSSDVSSEPVTSEVESSVESEPETSEEVSSDTQLNEDEAALIEAAKQKIMAETEFVEGEGFLFMIDGVEGQVVQINVREDGQDVASNVGIFRYDAETDVLYEQDYITGEFVEYPAHPE